MKAIAVVLLLSVVVGAWTAEDETFTSDFTTTEGVAREVQSVAVERNPELATPAQTVAQLPEHGETDETEEDADEEVAEESFAELSATPAEAAALKEAAATLKAAGEKLPAAVDPNASPVPVSPQVAEIVRKVAAIVTLIPKVPGVEAAAGAAAGTPAAAAAAAAAGKGPGAPGAPPAGAVAGKGPGAIPAGSTAAAAVGAAPPAPPVPAVAPAPPKPAPRPSNPLVKKVPKVTNALPPMAGPPVQDVSAKKLRQAQIARSKAEVVNRRLRQKLKRLRKRMQRRLRMEREKCAGKCDRKFPITVGPHHIPNTETRSVVMEGDRAENKKRWSAVKTHKRLMWLPKKLKKVYKFHDRVGKRIRKHHDYIKKTRAAPLVERHGKFIVKNWKDYDVMKEFKL